MTEATGVPIVTPPTATEQKFAPMQMAVDHRVTVTQSPPRPGYKTTEFYLHLIAMALTALFASGVLTNSTVLAIAGAAAAWLTSLGYAVNRSFVKKAAVLLLVALMSSSAMACGVSAREKTIATTYATTNAAWSAFSTFDLAYPHALVDKAPDKATLDKELADYHAKQTKILATFAVVYRAIAAAETANDQPTFEGMVQAALILSGALHDLGVNFP